VFLSRKVSCLTVNEVSERTHTVSVRMTDQELEMLHAVAAVAGLSQSDWVRQRVRHEYAERPTQPKKKRGKR
jgi:hypothetical protein